MRQNLIINLLLMEKIIIIWFLASGVCTLLYMLWVRLREISSKQPTKVKEQPNLSEEQLKEKYSSELADSCIGDYRDYREFISGIMSSPQTDERRIFWERLNQIQGKKIISPEDMLWFADNVEKFINYGEILAYIEYYPELEDWFLFYLSKPNQNIELQKKLISISASENGQFNYSNLLCKYICVWDFLPEIKAVLVCDSRFRKVKKIYGLYTSVRNHN